MPRRRKLTETERRKTSFHLIIVSIIVTILLIIIFNRSRFVAISDLDNTVSDLTTSIDSLEDEVDSLRTEIDRLLNDSLYMEQVIRETLGWGREEESIIRFIRTDTTEVTD
ncbi:MAG: septum formation initiator family protein [FCB group bacterium]|nr:septum formation initiator family protein [FCB group bacterium]